MINLLIVEDSKTIQRFLTENINTSEFNILAILSKGDEAIDYIVKNENIDIVLLDINLDTHITGCDVAETIQNKIRPGIIFHTSISKPEFFDQIEKYNPLAYLLKPTSKEQLEITLKVAVKNLLLKLDNEAKQKSLLDQNIGISSFIQLYDKPIVVLQKSKILECNTSFLDFIGTSQKTNILGQYFYKLLPNYQSNGVHSVIYFEKQFFAFESNVQSNFELFIKKRDTPNELVKVEMIKIDSLFEKYLLVINRLDEKAAIDTVNALEFRKLTNIYNSIHLAILLIDTSTFRIVDVNPYTLSFFNKSKSEIKRMQLSEVFPDAYVRTIINQQITDNIVPVTLKIDSEYVQAQGVLSKVQFLNESFILLSLGKITKDETVKIPNPNIEKKQEVKQLQEKHQKFSESLIYAKRIQSAMMSSKDFISRYLDDSFVFWKPKEIVSGDFYWSNYRNGHLYFALGDATGHGVPAAFMTILGMSYLNEITVDLEKGKASQVVDILRHKVVKSLNQKTQFGDLQDGFDMAFLVINLEKMRMQFSAANMSVYMIRNGQMAELKGDRMPVGLHPKIETPFKNHHLRLEKGDRLYLFSDGIIHQFGGENNKKLNHTGLKKLLFEIQNLKMKEQEEKLKSYLKGWINKQEQVDDILVVGLQI